ncbi:unnamed protein product [marine sediment metagenome]|uniref:Uncharacterized protein n=1 Tax=marine sediment metagenome TaxID=412755 RepID=X1IJV2_9ZZZZ
MKITKRNVYYLESNEEYPIFSFSEDELDYEIKLTPKFHQHIKKILKLYNSTQKYLKKKLEFGSNY